MKIWFHRKHLQIWNLKTRYKTEFKTTLKSCSPFPVIKVNVITNSFLQTADATRKFSAQKRRIR